MGKKLKKIAKCKTQRAFLFCDLYDHLSSSWSLNDVFLSLTCKKIVFFSCESLPCVLGSSLYKYIIHLYIKYEYRPKRNVLISINIFLFKWASLIFLMKSNHHHMCVWISYLFMFVIVLANNVC